jgi:hypothetical protein
MIRDVPQQAVPPLRYPSDNRRKATCRCGEGITASCFGWVHASNSWIKTLLCGGAKPV